MGLLDPTLPHQLLFFTNKGKIRVTCNCRLTAPEHTKGGKLYYDPIDEVKDFVEAKKVYNIPDNHWGPFYDEDKI